MSRDLNVVDTWDLDYGCGQVWSRRATAEDVYLRRLHAIGWNAPAPSHWPLSEKKQAKELGLHNVLKKIKDTWFEKILFYLPVRSN